MFGDRRIDSLESIGWYSFLARPRLPSPEESSLLPLGDASILVTGAGGSIGRALSMRLAALRPRALVLLDASEQALFRLDTDLKATGIRKMPTLVLASISDRVAMEEVFSRYRPSLVFHAAAHKHVALLEEHPLAAIDNNALGTERLTQLAQEYQVQRFVLLSTDKAVEPVSILGATKQIAEQITLARNGIVVRLTNVLGTEGSVVDILLHAIRSGKAITIRHRLSERYFLTIEEAVDLLLFSAVDCAPGSLLIPRLDRAHRIVALAEFLISLVANGKRPVMQFHELHSGEKISERLHSADESIEPNTGDDGAYVLVSTYPRLAPSFLSTRLAELRLAVDERNLTAALDAILMLAPGYTPSATLRSHALAQGAGVLQR